jgi:deoxyribodipyrimidine photolyase
MSTLRTEFQKELLRRNKEVLIKEAIIAIVAEQAVETQLQQATPIAPQNPPVSSEIPPETTDTTQQTQPQEEQITVDMMVDKLNVIRGGSSFSDPEVYGQLTTFWNSLPEDQKNTIDNILNNVGKIVSIAEPSEAQQQTQAPNAPAPAAPPAAQIPSATAPISPSQPV